MKVIRISGSPRKDGIDKPFWEKTYCDDTVSTFGAQPNKAIEDMWKSFDKNWSILDVGCGEGKNPIFL